jgi:GNAT superfamily N-acetyltransferase
MMHPRAVGVRAARPGEGAAISALWRELWDAHEGWGGYAASRDDEVYARLSLRLDDDARARAGQPVLGRHIHVVATHEGAIAGQVEGWFERHGVSPDTPYTCEVRSLIVGSWARGAGLGRALLDGLADAVARLARNAGVILAAEVLEPNPAQGFYARLGYVPVSWSLRVSTDSRAVAPSAARSSVSPESFTARVAEPRDALALCILDTTLATRRRALGDNRFDKPRGVDATTVAAIATHLAQRQGPPHDSVEIVTTDGSGQVRASATFAVGSLDAPFLPSRRALLGRFATDPALDATVVAAPMITFAARLAAQRGAAAMELTDLPQPSTPLYQAGILCGAAPWSRILTKRLPDRA